MQEINGYDLHGAFREGAKRLRGMQAELNRINLFPVPDGDTGTNMAATLTYAVETSRACESAADTLDSMAEAAFAGARGNSGVIFAQFISGLRESLSDARTVSLPRFAAAIGDAYRSAKRAVSDPKDGTILSVIRDWAAALQREASHAGSLGELFHAAQPDLSRSLESTRESLEVLRKAGFVDAGASGFAAFVEGAKNYIERAGVAGIGGSVPAEMDAEVPDSPMEASGPEFSAEGGPRFCAEFLLAGDGIHADAVRASLTGLGDSLIVGGTSRSLRIHIHSDRPAEVRAAAARAGSIIEQKVDDMYRQRQDAHAPVSNVALVTDSTCDLPRELLDRHRIHVVPLFLRFGDDEYLDRLTLDPESFYDRAEASAVFPSSSQPTPKNLERLFRELLGRYERVVAIHVSSKLSGTCEASRRAARSVDEKRITVADSLQLSGSLGLIVLRAAQALESGMGADELVAALPAWSAKAEILVAVRSLASMVRGGRVSPLGGFIAKLLDLKPIVSLDAQGASKLYGASFGFKGSMRKILRMAAARGRRDKLRSWALVHGHAETAACELAQRLETQFGFPPLYICEISAVVGMNAGKGAVALVTMVE
jgi:uncharacterized protein